MSSGTDYGAAHIGISDALDQLTGKPGDIAAEILVGMKVRHLRGGRRLSLRALAELSGLNINTLSLIENGKSSPSVGTLQQLANALKVPLVSFFKSEPSSRQVVFTPRTKRPGVTLNNAQMHSLGKDLAGNAVQPFVVTLEPQAGSGERMIEHAGHEFVYCLDGTVQFKIGQETYLLESGDSLVFESRLPHQWQNNSDTTSQFLLVIYPVEQQENLVERHFEI